MRRFVNLHKGIQSEDLTNKEEVLSWRNQPSNSSRTPRSLLKNQNAIRNDHSQNDDISSLNKQQDQQLLNASSPSVNLTTQKSKPSRHESIQTSTFSIRQRQHDRYKTYHHRLKYNQLYSLIISSNGVECYGNNCQPSVFNESYGCRKISLEKDLEIFNKTSLMDEQDIKQNMSFISLTNLSNIIDHEPNVSRRDSYSQSMSNILTHKTSLFLADIFNKMTDAQRAQSIAQLVKYHESLTKSNITNDRLERTTSLPNLSHKTTKSPSVTSLLSGTTAVDEIHIENKSLTGQADIDKQINPEEPSSDKQTVSSSIKVVSPLEHQLSAENRSTMHTNDLSADIPLSLSASISHPATIKSSEIPNKSSNEIEKRPTSKSEQLKTQSSNISNSMVVKKSPSTNKTNSENDKNLLSKSNTEKLDSKHSAIIKDNQAIPSSPHFQSSTDENSLNDATDHLSQHDMTPPTLENSFKQFNTPKQTLSVLQTTDELSQHSYSSYSSIKNSTSFSTPIKPDVTRPTDLPLTNTDDDEEQSKLINEQLKRNSLGLARDSLELLRSTIPHQRNSDEQLNTTTPEKRKSALKSRLDSSNILPTPELISYIAIDEIEDEKNSVENQMRRRSLTIGGGTLISCTSPKPKRDSLILLQQRYSESQSPHLSNSDSKHVTSTISTSVSG